MDGEFPLVSILDASTLNDVTNSSGSDALGSSVLECRLYAQHTVRKDSLIGVTKDEIKLLLAEGAGGGLYIFHIGSCSLIIIYC